MLLVVYLNEPRQWYFKKEFQVATIPRIGEGIGLGHGWYEIVKHVAHDISTGIVEVSCHCDLSAAACFLVEIDDWKIIYQADFMKDEAEIRKIMGEYYEGEINFTPIFAEAED